MGISVHAHSRANQWGHHKMLAVFSGYAHNNLLHAQVNLHAIILILKGEYTRVYTTDYRLSLDLLPQ